MKCRNTWNEKYKWITWGSGGFGEGTLIRHCKCGWFESLPPKEHYKWELGNFNWSWDAKKMEECRKAFKKRFN